MLRSAVLVQMKRSATATVAAAVAFGFLGATTYEWAPIGKADRVSSPADCRSPKMNGAEICETVSLPSTSTETYEVAPGLTIVERVDH